MNRAQKPFTATGLKVPSYIAFGNHDGLVQGNAAANVAYEAVATGCIKPMSPVVADPGTLQAALGALDPDEPARDPRDAASERRPGAAGPEAPVRLEEAVQGGVRERHPG